MQKKAIDAPINGDFTNKNILSIGQFSKKDIDILFNEAAATEKYIKKYDGTDLLKRKRLVNIFFEPSTRTSSSFHFAMEAHGGSVKTIENVAFSSVAKGETLQDTVRALEQYAHVTVIRHSEIGAVSVAAEVAQNPIINGGDGVGEHPTQALLDLFTIKQRLGHLDGITVTMVGDLKNGRTVHSLAQLLSHYGATLNYVSPKELSMPKSYTDPFKHKGIAQSEHQTLSGVLPKTDVLYVTRVQGERFLDPQEYERLKLTYTITPKVLKDAKKDMIIMHPLPRVGEIDTAVDSDPRAAYFEQMRYGMYVRMSLLALVLGRSIQK